jgi:gliding motility-associated-like protein
MLQVFHIFKKVYFLNIKNPHLLLFGFFFAICINKYRLLKNHFTCMQRCCMLAVILLCHTVGFAQPKAAFTSSVTAGCNPVVVQFKDASTGSPTSWKWDLGNGNTSTQKNPGAIYNNPGTYTIKLTVKNAAGTDSIKKTSYITVYAKPTIDFDVAPPTGCLPLSVQFTDKTTNDTTKLATWTWDFGDGEVSTDQSPKHIYTTVGNFSVSLSVTNKYGCSSFLQKQSAVNVDGAVNTDFDYSYANACSPPTIVTFNNNTASGSQVNYQWYFGDGGSSADQNPVYTYNTNGKFNIQLIAITNSGCRDTVTKSISIGTVTPNFIMPSGSCANKKVIFTDSSSPTPIFIAWDFGDNKQGIGATVGHSYSAPGSYPVKMIANFGTCTDSITKVFTVTNKPIAKFTATGNTNSCALPGIVQFQNASQNAVTYKWDFGDGQTSTQQAPSHTYKLAGFYDVTLIAINSNGCSDTLVAPKYIQLGPPRIDSLFNSPFGGCAPANVGFKAAISSGDPVTSYTWDFGDNSAVSNAATPTHKYLSVGTYTVKLKVVTATGCSDSATFLRAVLVGNKPQANFSASPTDACASVPIQFSDHSTGDVTDWNWRFGDGGTSNESNPAYKYTDTGYFSVTIIVRSNGCPDSVTLKNYVHVTSPIAKYSVDFQCGQKLTRTFTDHSINATSWAWDFGDGQTSNVQNPKHNFKKAGVYYVSLTVTNGNCTDTKTDTLSVVNQAAVFSYTPAKTTLCKYDVLTFTASKYDTLTVSSIYWNFGDGNSLQNFGNVPTAKHAYTRAGSYTPFAVIQNKTGCRDTVLNSALVFTVYGPTAAFTNTTGICVNGTVTFNDNSTTDGLHPIKKWIWNYGDSKTDSLAGGPFSHIYNKAGSYNVKLKILDSYGCYDTLVRNNADTVTSPRAAFTLADSTKCLNSLVSFVDSSKGVSLNYNWSFGDGTTSNQTAPQHQYLKLGTYTVALGVTDKFGCRDTITKVNYVVIANPTAKFTNKDSLGVCPPLIIHPVSSSINYTFLTWDFGDGNTSNVANPVHYYNTAGNYTLKLTAQGHGNCISVMSKPVVVLGPSGKLSYSPLTLCNSDSVKFTATGHKIVSYTWDFADGGTLSGADSSFKYAYNNPGRFLPQLIIVDSSGCQVTLSNVKDTIQVGGVTAAFTAQTAPGCDSATVTFTDNSAIQFDALKSRLWSMGDGTTTNVQNPVHYYKKTGTETVILKLVTNIGCTSADTLTVPVTVNQAPIVKAVIPTAVCVNSPATYSATNNSVPKGTINWLWQFGNGDTVNLNGDVSSQIKSTYTYTTSNTYTVAVTATNEFGCTDSVHGTITVNPLPVVNAGNDTALCFGQQLILQPTGAATYNWAGNNTLSCTSCQTPVAKPDTSSWYFVTGKSLVGCTAEDSIHIAVKKPFTVKAPVSDTLCTGFSVQLNATGAETYSWQPTTALSNPGIANPMASPTTTTTYTVTGTDSLHCFTATADVVVNVFGNPTVNIIDSVVTIMAGASYLPSTTASPDVVQWQWQPPVGLSCTNCAQPTMAPKQTTRYKEKVFNQYGCSATDYVTVQVLCNNKSLYIPNTFSPNGDNANDYFYPRGGGLFNIKSLRIFNRWGQPVFQKLNFAANDPSSGWDGKFNGQAAPADVYVYIVEVVCTNGTVVTSKGDITLLR